MIPPHERRNYSEIYKKITLEKLTTEVSDFDFQDYLGHMLPRTLESEEEVVMYALPYYKRLTNLISMTDKR